MVLLVDRTVRDPRFLFKRDSNPGYHEQVPPAGARREHPRAEFCGLDHAKMTLVVKVVSMADYRAWIAEQQATRSGATP